MRLTRFSDIGLRVLIYLERAGDGRALVTVAEIGAQYGIPVNHLVKVVGHLARVGWVKATRGRNGGIWLAEGARRLGIGTILRELEGDDELVDCEAVGCRLSMDCRLRAALAEGMRAFYAAMDRYTLADMTQGGTGEYIIQMHRTFLNHGGAAA